MPVTANGWSEIEKATSLFLSLSGQALEVLQTIPDINILPISIEVQIPKTR